MTVFPGTKSSGWRSEPPAFLRLSTVPRRILGAFSLVEVLAAIAIIGIITFLAIPNILRIKEDGEQSLAVSRAEALNMAMASYLQANGQASAASVWGAASDNDARYALLTPYVAFAPAALDDFMPTGYSVSLPASLSPLTKVTLSGPSGAISY